MSSCVRSSMPSKIFLRRRLQTRHVVFSPTPPRLWMQMKGDVFVMVLHAIHGDVNLLYWMLLCPPKLKQTKADKDSFIYYMFIYVLDSILLCYVHILDSMILDSSCFVIPKHSIESVSLSTHTHTSHTRNFRWNYGLSMAASHASPCQSWTIRSKRCRLRWTIRTRTYMRWISTQASWLLIN